VDSLFFYAPAIDGDNGCLYLDDNLQKIASILRSLTDAFYLLRVIFQFRTGFADPSSSGAFGRGVLVDDMLAIAKRYLSTYFLIDILAILPLPQVPYLSVLMVLYLLLLKHRRLIP
jgi:cyclic nucleotide gated channel